MSYSRVIEIRPEINQHIFDLPCVSSAYKTASGNVIYKLFNVRKTNYEEADTTYGYNALAQDFDGYWWLLSIDEYLDTLII